MGIDKEPFKAEIRFSESMDIDECSLGIFGYRTYSLIKHLSHFSQEIIWGNRFLYKVHPFFKNPFPVYNICSVATRKNGLDFRPYFLYLFVGHFAVFLWHYYVKDKKIYFIAIFLESYDGILSVNRLYDRITKPVKNGSYELPDRFIVFCQKNRLGASSRRRKD